MQVKCLKPGKLSIGVARKLNQNELEAGIGEACADGIERWWTMKAFLKESDVIGVAFGQSDLPNLSFTKNGKPLPSEDVKKIGGLVYPVIGVTGDAVVQVMFESNDFEHPPPSRFSPLMVAQSVL
jgi:hypothetical protein